MELKQLKIFSTLSKELSFTRTAEILGYTQANITIQIRLLENELNARLFNRDGRTVTLTEDGRKLLPIAERMISLESTIYNLREEESGSGRIRIGVCDPLCVSRLPNIIEEYKRIHPRADISLNILKCSEFAPLLRKDHIDLAFTIGYLRKEEDICYINEQPEPIHVMAAPEHPLAKRRMLTPSDFDGVPLILAEKAAYYRQNFEQELIRANITPHIMLETESIQAIKRLSEKGLGVCVLPRIAALDELADGRLVALDYSCNYGICSHIIWHRDKLLTACQKEFLRYSSTADLLSV